MSIRPLRHADLQALLAHLDHHEHDDERLLTGPGGRWPAAGGPVVAVRVRASVGRPGASAQAEYRRRRAAERAAWTRGLPWRAAAVLAAGVTAGLLAAQLAPHLAGLLAVCWPRPGWAGGCGSVPAPTPGPGGAAPPGSGAPPACSPPWSATAGRSCTTWPSPARQANIDHLVIGPGGVLVDRLQAVPGAAAAGLATGCSGMAATCSSRPCARSAGRPTRPTRSSASPTSRSPRSSPSTAPASPGAGLQADGVTVVPARRVPDLLQALPPILGPERVAWLADRARLRFRAAA